MSAAPLNEVPPGVRALRKLSRLCCPRLRINREWCYRSSVLVLTYIAYTCYHMSRKPISVVKAVLHQNCSTLTPPADVQPNSTWCDWAPFDGSDSDASALLGTLDSAFLFSYAIAMFGSGFIAERVNLNFFLSIGMILSGLADYLFGIARSYNIHSLSYFIFVQAFGGICQTTGWPGVVAVVGNWFGKGKRGLLFGIWNSHTSLGNILGSLIAGRFVETNWAYSFIIPGVVMASAGFIVFLFLVVSPTDVGLLSPNSNNKKYFKQLENRAANVGDSPPCSEYNGDSDDSEAVIGNQHTERSRLLINHSQPEEKAIGFLGACRIPGVIEFSLSLFFSKLVSYTFLYWLPLFLAASTTLGPEFSGYVSTVFDVGGIVGAIAAGVISDYSGMSATTCIVMLFLSAPMMFVYQHFCTISLAVNMTLLVIVGILVNGPYALITTAVSAELGTHSSLEGNAKAVATVTAIIDGTGSIGAAVGPLLAGVVSSYGWSNVFYMLIASDILALLLLVRLVKQELSRYKQSRRTIRIE